VSIGEVPTWELMAVSFVADDFGRSAIVSHGTGRLGHRDEE
jgi:hypothetical protein